MLALNKPDSQARAQRPPSPSLLAQYVHGHGDQLGSEAAGPGRPARVLSQKHVAPMGQDLVFPDLMQKRVERSTARDVERRGRDTLHHLVNVCREAERRGRGQECTQFCSLRRMRGLDVLYGLGPEAEEEDEEPGGLEGGRPGSRAGTPSLLTRPSTAASTGSQQPLSRSSVSLGGRKQSTGRRRHSLLATGNLAARRAGEILRSAAFFQRLEASNPGVLAQLTVGSTFSTERAGQVIFRQGDPPSSCYVVASGQVVIYKYTAASPPSSPSKRKQLAPTPRERYEARMCASLTESLAKKVRAREVNGAPRYATTEGFSTFFETSVLGKEVARLGPGGVFGERALQEDDVRAASAVCEEDCEFLVIQSTLYKQVMRESIEKVGFLNTNLPGLRNLPYTQAERHPSFLFVLETFPEGHTFLHEGTVTLEPAIYVIRRGTVEFRRSGHASHCPAHMLAGQPLTQPARGLALLRCRGARSEGSLGALADDAAVTGHLKADERPVWDTLSEGDVFASLAVLPLLSAEPFTAVSAKGSGCEVYRAQGAEILGLPVKLLKPLRRQLMRRLMTRLVRVTGASEVAPGQTLKLD